MSCRIRIICDNSAGPLSGTLGEHGFAALIERDGESILFDTEMSWEGMGGIIPIRLMVQEDELDEARQVLQGSGPD